MSLYTRFLLVLLLCSSYQAIPSPNGSPSNSSTSVESGYARKPAESKGVWNWLGGWCSTAHNYLLGDEGLITNYVTSFFPGWKKKPEIRRCCCPPEGEPKITSSDGEMEVRSVKGKLGSGSVCVVYFWYNLGEGVCKFAKYTTLAVGDLVIDKCKKLCGCKSRY